MFCTPQHTNDQNNGSEEQIPESRYLTFGEVQYISVKQGANLHVKMNGIASGSFTLDMEEVVSDTITASSTFAGVPSATSTIASIDIPLGNIANASPLRVDKDGDGKTDFTMNPKLGSVVLPDFTPPEISISFSNNQVVLSSNEKAIIEITKSKISLSDESGNTTIIPLLKSEKSSKEFEISFDTIIYNGITTKIPKVSLEYEWGIKNGMIKELKQGAKIKDSREIEMKYQREKNETKIQDGKIKIIKDGIIPLVILTNNGNIELSY